MERNCDSCGTPYLAKRDTSRFCSNRCQKRHKRGAAGSPAPVDETLQRFDLGTASGLLDRVTKDLTSAGLLDTPQGQLALVLATRLSGPTTDTGSAIAAVSRELRSILSDLLGNSEQAADPIDELKKKREQRLSS